MKGDEVKNLMRALAGIIIVGLCGGLEAMPGRTQRLVVRLYKIPGDQSFESSVPDGKGGSLALHANGSVNALFPRATVFFPTELAANASGEAVAEAIVHRIAFGSAGLVARNIRVDEIKSFDLELGQDHSKAEGRFEESRGDGRTSDYRVEAVFLSAEKGRFLVRLRLDVGWSSFGGSLGVGMSGDVISAPFEVPESKLLLVGGPSWEKPSGAVYWLAVSLLAE